MNPTRWKTKNRGNLSVFRNLEEVRQAVTEFRDRYNRHWRFEKLGFMSPLEARQAHAIRKAA